MRYSPWIDNQMVVIDERPWLDPATVEVWLLHRAPGRVGIQRADRVEYLDVQEGGVPTLDGVAPSFRLPEAFIEQLTGLLLQVQPPNQSMAAHLADAIAVRDRLLALAERN